MSLVYRVRRDTTLELTLSQTGVYTTSRQTLAKHQQLFYWIIGRPAPIPWHCDEVGRALESAQVITFAC